MEEDTEPFEPITSRKSNWGAETFMDGEALFGDIEDGDTHE